MKLKRFNRGNTKQTTNGKASIRLHRQGQISLSRTAVSNMGLKVGDKIEFVQDEDKPEDWYLEVNTEKGFPLRAYKNATHLLTNSSSMVKVFRTALKVPLEETSVGCLIASDTETIEGAKLWPIITSSAT